MKIGIPRGLLYYNYFTLWKTFYEDLGFKTVLSPETNKSILDLGVKTCVDEACLPVKVFHGHVEYLKDKVDFLFIPRYTSLSYGEFTCPKICGLPEMIIHSIADLPEVIKPDFNLHDRDINIDKTIREMVKPLKVKFKQARLAYNHGLEQIEIQKKHLLKENYSKNHLKKLLILAHPYNLYDNFINMNILKKLKDMGYSALTIDNVEEVKINFYAGKLPKKMFWTFGRQLIGLGLYGIAEKEKLAINGVIYLSSFACGLDSIIADYIERQIRRRGNLPFIQLTIDEHTGQAGVNTRIEAFIEMVERRKLYDSNISPYGECIYRS